MFGRDIIEVATFRANHSDARNENQAKQSNEGMLLRDNVYGTIEQDAERRDFTVNSLYYNPQDNTLRDYFDGIHDLKAGKLRLIGCSLGFSRNISSFAMKRIERSMRTGSS